MSAPMRVAVLGAGSVGREVIRALLERVDDLRSADGSPMILTGIAVRDVARAVAAGIPEALLTDAPAHLIADPDTDVIVELMGGDEPARTLMAAAIAAGKPVVTANKHVIAHHGAELEGLARRNGTPLRFEAAVGGGTPVLGPIATDLAANRLDAVRGIVNGTTNFILSAMSGQGRPYADVLADAQVAGYAEADPRGDVEGHDAANKLVILARLAFGRWLEPDSIMLAPGGAGTSIGLPGITGVTLPDIVAAAAQHLAIKLIAAAVRTSDGVTATVLPSAVPLNSPLGRTDGVLNRIEVDGSPVGSVAFSGPGAGGAATSSAVLADLMAIARQGGSTWAGLPAASGPVAADAAGAGDVFIGPSGVAYPVIR
ncbi:MAG: homoserine dehydrogenase [Chloroflexota bacterium]